MSDIFLSYKGVDRPRAESLSRELTAAGWDVWWDRSILPGETFDDVIEAELAAASCVVVLWTTDSVGASWVRAEAAEGRDRKILVPVMLDDVEIPLAFRRVQAADLTDWRPGEQHAEFNELLIAITKLAGPPNPVVTPPDNDDASEGISLADGPHGNTRPPAPNSAPTDRRDGDNPRIFRRRKLLMAVLGAAVAMLTVAGAIFLIVSDDDQLSADRDTTTTTVLEAATTQVTQDGGTSPTTRASATTLPTVAESTGYDEAVLGSGPIVYWPLADDSAMILSDLAGSHHLTLRDLNGLEIVPAHIEGPHGIGGLDFNRTAMQQLDSTFNPDARLGTGSWTLEFWMNPVTAELDDPGSSITVIGGFYSTQNRRWYILVEQGRLCVGIGGFRHVCGINPNVGYGEWHHVVLTYDARNGEATLYLDATRVTLEENPWGADEKLTDQSISVGAMLSQKSGVWQEHWNGGLSRIAIYKHVLEPQLIQDHYQAIDGS